MITWENKNLFESKRQDHRFLLIAVTFIIFGIVLSSFFFVEESYNLWIYALVLIFLLVYLVPFVFLPQRKIDILEPIYPFGAVYFVFFGASTVFMMRNDGFGPIGTYNYLPHALAIAIIGYIFLLLGYYKFPLRIEGHLPKLPATWNERKVKLIITVLYGFGWLARLVLLLRYKVYFNDVIGSYLGIPYIGFLFVISGFCLIALALVSVLVFQNKPDHKTSYRLKAGFSVIFMAEFIFSLFTGAKGGPILIMLVPLLAFYSLRGFNINRPKYFLKLAFSIGFFFFMVLLLFPVINDYRGIMGLGGDPTVANLSYSNVTFNFQQSSLDLINNPVSNTLSRSFEMTISRLSHIAELATVIEKTPDVMDFQLGKTYMPFFSSFIPRFIWPTRPQSILDNEFGRKYGLISQGDFITVVNIPAFPTELYINFHIIGVGIGMLLLGILFRLVYRCLLQYEEIAPISAFIYIFILLAFLESNEHPFAGVYMGLVRNLVLVYIIVYCVGYKHPTSMNHLHLNHPHSIR